MSFPAAEPDTCLPPHRSTLAHFFQVYGWAAVVCPRALYLVAWQMHAGHIGEKLRRALGSPSSKKWVVGWQGNSLSRYVLTNLWAIHYPNLHQAEHEKLLGETPFKRKKKVWKGSILNGMRS